jgi:hypothetical protein
MSRQRPGAFLARFLLASPFAWLGLAVVAVLHGLYAWWFQPGLLLQGAALAADLVLLGIGVALALTSPRFRAYVNRGPHEEIRERLRGILPRCTERFQQGARESLALIDDVAREFRDQAYGEELGTLVNTLGRLAESNAELTHRLRTFGTDTQKKQMQRALDAQVESLGRMQASLKELAGNLSLIEAASDQQAASSGSLRDINAGLEEVMKELSSEPRSSS